MTIAGDMREVELKARTQRFALDAIRLSYSLPRDSVGSVIGRQLLRSATSVGANYCAACRARSRSDFIAKLKIVEEETDETAYWLELLDESKTLPAARLSRLLGEADELLRIVVSSIRTARVRQKEECAV
jgi:four helix bundle protein